MLAEKFDQSWTLLTFRIFTINIKKMAVPCYNNNTTAWSYRTCGLLLLSLNDPNFSLRPHYFRFSLYLPRFFARKHCQRHWVVVVFSVKPISSSYFSPQFLFFYKSTECWIVQITIVLPLRPPNAIIYPSNFGRRQFNRRARLRLRLRLRRRTQTLNLT